LIDGINEKAAMLGDNLAQYEKYAEAAPHSYPYIFNYL